MDILEELGGLWRYTWRERICGGFDGDVDALLYWLMTWRLGAWGGSLVWSLEVVELSCGAWSWRHVAVLFHILLASWSLLPLGVGFLKPLLVGSKRHKLGLVQRVGTLISVGAENIWEDWSLPHHNNLLYQMVFINTLLSFPFTSDVPCLSGWAIVLMHWWLINVVCAI